MVHNLSLSHSLVSNWVAELRDVEIQKDRMRFRTNLERIAEVTAYEISKILPATDRDITTPMSKTSATVLAEQPVLATILRAGLAMHNGLLRYFDKADNAFLSAYRKHQPDGTFEIRLEYMSCPEIEGRIVIISDPMLATGASLVKSIQFIKEMGNIKQLHIACAIACKQGIAFVQEHIPEAEIWCAVIDEELTDKGYIVPVLVMPETWPMGRKCSSKCTAGLESLL